MKLGIQEIILVVGGLLGSGYCIWYGWMVVFRKKNVLLPTAQIAIWIVRTLRGDSLALRKEQEIKANLSQTGYFSLVAGFFLLVYILVTVAWYFFTVIKNFDMRTG